MSTIKISCTIGATDPTAALGVEVWNNHTKLFDEENFNHESLPLSWDIEDDGDHELRFVLKNKTQKHTTIDDEGNIVKDASITISDLTFEEIELKQIFFDKAVYLHDFNGTQEVIEDKFYGTMGCNGSVKLKFSSPVYLWLLENY